MREEVENGGGGLTRFRAGVTEGNMMQYLGIIEQRTNEILQIYAAIQMQQQVPPAPAPQPFLLVLSLPCPTSCCNPCFSSCPCTTLSLLHLSRPPVRIDKPLSPPCLLHPSIPPLSPPCLLHPSIPPLSPPCLLHPSIPPLTSSWAGSAAAGVAAQHSRARADSLGGERKAASECAEHERRLGLHVGLR
eukprot:765698-Hanusia_phi.AAC.10